MTVGGQGYTLLLVAMPCSGPACGHVAGEYAWLLLEQLRLMLPQSKSAVSN